MDGISHRLRRRDAAFGLAGAAALIAAAQTGAQPVAPLAEGQAVGRRFAAPAPSAAFDLPPRRVQVRDGAELAYYEVGQGRPVLFLHGMPTWSHLWRNVMPFIAAAGHRAIALDLLGFGRSGRPEGLDLGYAEQVRHLGAFTEALGLRELTLVLHDFGAAFGLDHASRHADAVRGIAYLEAAIAPVWPRPDLASFGPLEPLFRRFRDPVQGPLALMEENLWVERLLPASLLRPLGEAEMAAYRAPFPDRASRRVMFELIRSVPVGGEPVATAAAMARTEAWWRTTPLPKLVLYADPSRVTPENLVRWALDNLRNVETAYVGRGIHYLQEDEPEAIGWAIVGWLRRLPV